MAPASGYIAADPLILPGLGIRLDRCRSGWWRAAKFTKRLGTFSMSKQTKTGLNVERIVSIIALIVGLFALYFSWDANRVAREANEISLRQVTPKVIPLSVEYASGAFVEKENGKRWISCATIVRLSNVGGASTDIVEQEATVYFDGLQQAVSSTGAYAYAKQPLADAIGNLDVVFIERGVVKGLIQDTMSQENIDTSTQLAFPVRIDAFATIELFPRISLMVDSSRSTWDPMKNDPQSFMYDPKVIEGHMPLDVVYTFKLASGQIVTSPRTTCFYIK